MLKVIYSLVPLLISFPSQFSSSSSGEALLWIGIVVSSNINKLENTTEKGVPRNVPNIPMIKRSTFRGGDEAHVREHSVEEIIHSISISVSYLFVGAYQVSSLTSVECIVIDRELQMISNLKGHLKLSLVGQLRCSLIWV